VTREIGTQPVIMVRKKDSGVSVFLNRCMHRGTMLCPTAGGHTRTFACPYHGWTYDARATMVSALLDGRALTASELAFAARITPQTASTHLAKLTEAGLLPVARNGRHRYFRLASPTVADMIDGRVAIA